MHVGGGGNGFTTCRVIAAALTVGMPQAQRHPGSSAITHASCHCELPFSLVDPAAMSAR